MSDNNLTNFLEDDIFDGCEGREIPESESKDQQSPSNSSSDNKDVEEIVNDDENDLENEIFGDSDDAWNSLESDDMAESKEIVADVFSQSKNKSDETYDSGKVQNKENRQENDTNEDGHNIPQLVGSCTYDPEFVSIVRRVQEKYKLLPLINENEIYAELADLTIRSKPTKTIEIVNQELQRAQASKERLSEIWVTLSAHHSLKKRSVDMLIDAWSRFSKESSNDKRKGDANFRLSEFQIDFANIEAMMKAASHISKNLDSLQENLSRRITIFQLQLKLHEYGRGALPDYDFQNINQEQNDDNDDLLQGDSDKEPGDDSLRAEEESF